MWGCCAKRGDLQAGVLDRYCEGHADERTLPLLEGQQDRRTSKL
jgi:hypothetical protein